VRIGSVTGVGTQSATARDGKEYEGLPSPKIIDTASSPIVFNEHV